MQQIPKNDSLKGRIGKIYDTSASVMEFLKTNQEAIGLSAAELVVTHKHQMNI